MALEDTFIGDLTDIRSELAEALKAFEDMPVGRAWDGNVTGNLDPSTKPMIVDALKDKIAAVDEWLKGNWTTSEEMIVMWFVGQWETASLTIKNFGYTGVPDTPVPPRGQPIPPLDPPVSLDEALAGSQANTDAFKVVPATGSITVGPTGPDD